MSSLEKMIEEYGSTNKKVTILKKEADFLNKEIKKEMQNRDLTDYESDNWKVTYQIRKSETLDEEEVIKLLTEAELDEGIVKYKPYIDEDALEVALYKGEIPADIVSALNDCKVVKETIALLVKEKK